MKQTVRGAWGARAQYYWFVLSAVLLAFLVGIAGCRSNAQKSASGDAGASLISGLSPLRTDRVRAVDTLNDGIAAREGDTWKSNLTAVFTSRDAFVVYDLGQVRKIGAVWLQGDNNDRYVLSVSKDGETFSTIWQSPPEKEGGLRQRSTQDLTAEGRYLRVSATGGDGNYSLSEVQVFESSPGTLPSGLVRKVGAPLDQNLRDKILLFALAAGLSLLLTFRGAPRWWLGLNLLLPAIAAFQLAQALELAWPVGQREVSLVRGSVALLAAVAIAREVFAPARFRAQKHFVLATLAICGVGAILAFYNLGQPQFWDNKQQARTPVHYLDLRQYYSVAKYFDEIGYWDLYRADMAAYAEDTNDGNLDPIASVPMRDLTTHEVSTVQAQRAEIERIKQKFSKERWEEYKRDARYFRDTMGRKMYFDTMYDLGGNATPVWMSIAYGLFNVMEPSNLTFLITGLLDPLLLLAAFVAIGWAFGLRTAFVCMVIFGANDFIMYGTNWAGATLRHDWMAYLALGACAIRKDRPLLGGAFLALATLIRAFPVVAIAAATLPALWWVFDYWREHKKLPPLSLLRREHRTTERVLIGAAGTLVGLIALSSALLGPSSWFEWLHKVGLLTSDPHANHISLRSFIAGWQANQHKVLQARLPLFIAAVAGYAALIITACRGKRVEQAAMLGLIFIPVLFYPANYYIHFIFLLPLFMVERRGREDGVPPLRPVDAWIAFLLLGLCAAQYWTVLITDLGLHFYLASVLLFTALTGLLLNLVGHDAQQWAWLHSPRQVAGQAALPAVMAASPAAVSAEDPDPDSGSRSLDRAEPTPSSDAQSVRADAE